MAEEKKTRNYRSKDERKEEIEKKIAYHKECIKTLEAKKAAIEKGRQGGKRQKSLNRLISDAKLPSDELLKVMTLGDEEKIRARLIEIIEANSKKEDAED